MAFFKKFRDAQRPCCAALVAAAGSSSRMGGVNKLLQPLDGIPVLARTLTDVYKRQAILRAIQERDWNDTHRDAAPLRQAEDAVLLDTTALDFVQSEDALLHIIRERTGL